MKGLRIPDIDLKFRICALLHTRPNLGINEIAEILKLPVTNIQKLMSELIKDKKIQLNETKNTNK